MTRLLGIMFFGFTLLWAAASAPAQVLDDYESQEEAAEGRVFQRESPRESFLNYLNLARIPQQRERAKMYFSVELYLKKYNEYMASGGDRLSGRSLIGRREREQFIADALDSVSTLGNGRDGSSAIGGFLSALNDEEALQRLREVGPPPEVTLTDAQRRNVREAWLEVLSTRQGMDAQGRVVTLERRDMVFLRLSNRDASAGVWQWYWVEQRALESATQESRPAPERFSLDHVQDLRAQLQENTRTLSGSERDLSRARRRLTEREIERTRLLSEIQSAEAASGPRGTPQRALLMLLNAMKRGSFEEYRDAHSSQARQAFADRDAERRFRELADLLMDPQDLSTAPMARRGVALNVTLDQQQRLVAKSARVHAVPEDPDRVDIEVFAVDTLDGLLRAFSLRIPMLRVGNEWHISRAMTMNER